MATTRFTKDFEVWGSDDNLYVCFVKFTYSYDEGVWRDSDGGGYPPSSDIDWDIEYCIDEHMRRYETLPDCVCEDDITEAIENFIEEQEL